MSAPRTHYFNADFDLGLRPRPTWRERAVLVRQVRELSYQALVGAEEDDAALMHAEPPAEYLTYLREAGIPTPRILIVPEIDPASTLRPFGWSEAAVALNRRHHRPTAHPEPALIERVNGRSYGHRLESELDPDGPAGTLIAGVAELDRFLFRSEPHREWILKAEHGNAGLGNRRLHRSALSREDRRFVAGLLEEEDRLLIEPWLPRVRDWSVVFQVPFSADTARFHQAINTRDGALIGSLFDPESPAPQAGAAALVDASARIAAVLERDGYFGPVCVDAFEWRDGDRIRLRSLADLNCRLSMSDGAYRLWRKLAPDRTVLYRFFGWRRLQAPRRLGAALLALGDLAYTPSRRRGILFVSPFPENTTEPGAIKLATLLVGENRADVLSLEREFRSRFEA